MAAGFDIAIVAKTLSPLLGNLAKHAVGEVKVGLAKWRADDFSERLAKKLASADRVKTIWSRDHFVSLTKCYHPSKIDRNHDQVTISSIAELPQQNLVIEGIVGQGKSMFLQFLYLQELAGHGSGTIPLFVLLRTVTQKRSFTEHLKESLSNLEIEPSDKIFDYLAKSGSLTLLLDGFDELEAGVVTDTIAAIESLIFKYPTLRVIITSRPHSDIQKSRYFEVVQLSDLQQDDYDPFLKKLDVDIIRRNEIVTAIANSPADVVELISTPLMLTLVAYVYAAEKEIPSELPLFFECLFATTFVGHDKRKGGGFRREHYSGLSERKLQLLFEAFCFLALQKQIGRTLTGEEFANVFEEAQSIIEDAECSVENFKLDITKVACLMLEDGFDQTSFLHMSIAEYFAAAFIKRANDKLASRFYSYAVERYRPFRVTLSFLEKIDPYRFAKFYIVPPFVEFFASLQSTPEHDAEISTWLRFFSKAHHKWEVSFRKVDASDDLQFSGIRVSGGAHAKYGELVFDAIRRAIFKIATNETITESSFLENKTIFRLEEHSTDERHYITGIEGLCRLVGERSLHQEFCRAEQSLRVRFNQAKALIENEDGKMDLISW